MRASWNPHDGPGQPELTVFAEDANILQRDPSGHTEPSKASDSRLTLPRFHCSDVIPV